MALDEFVKEFAHLVLGGFEGGFSFGRSSIKAAQGFAVALLAGAQVAFLLKAVEQRVQAAGADLVPMAGQLLDHTEPENGFFGRVVKDMQPAETGVQVAIG